MKRRVLFVSHDAGGTIPPMIALAEAMVDRGHDVTVLSQPAVEARALSAGCRFVPFSTAGDYEVGKRIEDQLDLVLEVMTGPGPVADVFRVVAEHRADVVVVDGNLAGVASAVETLGIRSVILLHSLYRTYVDTWFGELWPFLARAINARRQAHGLPECGSWPELFAHHDRLYSVVPYAFDAPTEGVPSTMRHFGFLVPKPPRAGTHSAFPPGDGPTVIVGLSTTYQAQEALLARILDALGDMDVRVLATTGGQVDLSALTVPANAVLHDYVPHQLVLPETDVVVTHAGLGTIAGALSHGVPMVCAPIARDQPLNAERVVAVGAGEVVGVDPTADDVRRAVEAVLSNPDYRRAAEEVSRASTEAGGPIAAARDLETLVDAVV